MLLTIDVGNTNIEFGFFEGDTLRGSFRTMTKGTRRPTSWACPCANIWNTSTGGPRMWRM